MKTLSLRARRAVGVACTCIAFVACSSEQPIPVTRTESALSTPTSSSFSFTVPAGQSPDEGLLVASDAVYVGDRTTVGTATDLVAAAGTGGVEIGASSRAGVIRSRGRVFLRSNAVVASAVSSTSIERQAGVTCPICQANSAALDPVQTFPATVIFPASTTSVALEPGVRRQLAEGAYTTVAVKSNAALVLQAGTYYFDTLDVEPGGRLVIPTGGDAVYIYVAQQITFRGIFDDGGDASRLFIGFAGTTAAFVESPARGTFVAPRASLVLGGAGPHVGSFRAARIEVRSDTTVQYAPFRPDAVETASPAPAVSPPDSAGPPPALTGSGDEARRNAEAFVQWVSRSTERDAQAALDAVKVAEGNVAIATALVALAQQAMADDPTKALVTLSVLGQLRSATGESFFLELLSRAVPSGPPLDATHDITPAAAVTLEIYQAKAVDSLAYRGTPTAAAAVLQAAASHPSKLVRHKAIRAYLEAFGSAGRSELEARVAPADRAIIDKVDPASLRDSRDFNVRVDEFYAKHPEAKL